MDIFNIGKIFLIKNYLWIHKMKPIFPYIESRLTNLTAYIQNNCTADFFSNELESQIISLGFNPNGFYPIFQNAFKVAYEKFSIHIPQHPGRALFKACQIFNPFFFLTSNALRKIFVI